MSTRAGPAETPEFWLRAYVRSGDPDAAGRLFDATAPALFRVALTLAHDAASAEDALQETFLAALEHADRFEDGRPVVPWLMGILRRKVGRQRRDAVRVPDPDRLRREQPADDAAANDPAANAATSEERERVHAAIEALPEPYRSVALMRWRYGLEPAEIAHVRSEPPGTVRSLLHRAARKLEESLGALSAGLVAFAGVGLDAVRARVVEAAAQMRPAPTPVSAGTATATAVVTGGLLMGTTQKVLIGVAAALVLVLGGIGAWRLADREPAAVADVAVVDDATQPDEAPDRQRVQVDAARDEKTSEGRDALPVLPPPVDLSRADRDLDLHGRVSDADGEPIAGATLTVLRYPWRRASVLNHAGYNASETVAGSLSATDGTFLFRLRRGALVDLRVEAEGFVTQTVSDAQAGERLDIELFPRAAGGVDLVVLVTASDESPVEGAKVRVFTLGDLAAKVNRTETTDESGRALFAALPASVSLHAGVTAAGHGAPPWLEFKLPEKGEHVQTIQLPAGRTITGTITDATTGLPIVDALIGIGWTQRKSVRSGADGRYELVGWTGNGVNEIAVAADGYGREKETVAEREVINVVLRRGDTVTGRLFGPDGEPVVGALVTAIASKHDGRTQTTSFAHDTSTEDGRFRATGLRRDLVHTLVITAEGVGRTLLDFDPHPGVAGTIDLGDIYLPAGHAIEGVVLDAAGDPIPSIEVTLSGANADRERLRRKPSPDFFYGNSEERRTDDLGRFRFPDLAPGTYEIAAKPRGAPQRGTQVTLRDADVLDAVIQMARGRHVTVTVLGPDDAPLEGAWVAAIGVPGNVNGRTDAEGKCTLAVEAGQHAQLSASSFNSLPDDVIQPPAQLLEADVTEMTFQFLRGRVVRARILDAAGVPVDGIQVEIYGAGDRPNTATADSDGRIAHKVLTEKPVDLIVTGRIHRQEGRALRMERLPLRGEARNVIPGGEGVTIRCREIVIDRTLTVKVTGPDGEPLPDIRVWSFDASIAWDTPNVTDETGTITLTELPPEECSFVAYWAKTPASQDWLPPQQQRVEPNGQTITMVFRHAAEITGTVLDRDGNGVVGAGVSARLEDGSMFNGTTEAGGHFSIRVPADAPALNVSTTWLTPAGELVKASLDGVRPQTDIRLEQKK